MLYGNDLDIILRQQLAARYSENIRKMAQNPEFVMEYELVFYQKRLAEQYAETRHMYYMHYIYYST